MADNQKIPSPQKIHGLCALLAGQKKDRADVRMEENRSSVKTNTTRLDGNVFFVVFSLIFVLHTMSVYHTEV